VCTNNAIPALGSLIVTHNQAIVPYPLFYVTNAANPVAATLPQVDFQGLPQATGVALDYVGDLFGRN